jgi:hypothetical protein
MRVAARLGLTGQRGQASVELVGALPALLVVALVVMQLLALGWAGVLAGSAAEAGALAHAAGRAAEPAARAALPEWSRGRMRVAERRGVVTVSLQPPSPVSSLGRRLEVHARAGVTGG